MIPSDPDVTLRIESIMRRILTLLAAAVVRGQPEGVFNPGLNEKAVGNFLLCMTQGLRVLGKVVHDEVRLTAAVDVAMRALS
jgi:TetR/AcrR family transcriptional repressor of nem operon